MAHKHFFITFYSLLLLLSRTVQAAATESTPNRIGDIFDPVNKNLQEIAPANTTVKSGRPLQARATGDEYQSLDGTGNNELGYGKINMPFIRKFHLPAYTGDSTGRIKCTAKKSLAKVKINLWHLEPAGEGRPNPRNVSIRALSMTPYIYNTESASDLLPMWGMLRIISP